LGGQLSRIDHCFDDEIALINVPAVVEAEFKLVVHIVATLKFLNFHPGFALAEGQDS